MIVSMLALSLALGGTGYAASKLPDGEGVVTIGVDASVVLTQTTRVGLVCKTDGNLGSPSPAYAEHAQLTAVKVAGLH
jgi:hypothetical protein